MAIRIRITDVTKEDSKSLVSLAKYLLECAGHAMVEVPADQKKQEKKKTVSPILKKPETVSKEIEDVEAKPESTPEEITTRTSGYENCTVSIPSPPNEPINFNTFMVKITGLCSAGKIKDMDILNLVRDNGLIKIHDLQSNPEILVKVNSDLDKLIGGMV